MSAMPQNTQQSCWGGPGGQGTLTQLHRGTALELEQGGSVTPRDDGRWAKLGMGVLSRVEASVMPAHEWDEGWRSLGQASGSGSVVCRNDALNGISESSGTRGTRPVSPAPWPCPKSTVNDDTAPPPPQETHNPVLPHCLQCLTCVTPRGGKGPRRMTDSECFLIRSCELRLREPAVVLVTDLSVAKTQNVTFFQSQPP